MIKTSQAYASPGKVTLSPARLRLSGSLIPLLLISLIIIGTGGGIAYAADIDGAVNGVADGIARSAGVVRRSETGNVRNYAAILGAGVVLLLAWFVIGRGVL